MILGESVFSLMRAGIMHRNVNRLGEGVTAVQGECP